MDRDETDSGETVYYWV